MLELAQNYPAGLTSGLYAQALGDTISLVRLVALNNYNNTDFKQLVNKISMMLTDPMLAIRTQAAYLLSGIPIQYHDTNFRKVYQKALTEYIETQEYVADFAAGRHNLGSLYSNLGRYEEAVENYLAAIEIDNKFYPSKINLATVYSQTGKGNLAEKLLADVLSENPDLDDVYYSYALLLAENKKYDLSLIYLLEASRRMPERARVWYNLGNMYQYYGENDLAEKAFRKTIDLEPENIDYHYNLLRHFVAIGDLKSAKQYASEIYQKFPHNPDRQNLLQFINTPSN
jgi:tetratricopeptide (TPR) repeat protein